MSSLRIASLSLLGCAIVALTGCSASFSPSLNEPGTYTIHPIHGTLYGGQQPITGGHVYLYATGTTGLYSNSRSALTVDVLANNPGFSGIDGDSNYYVVSDSNGNFGISGDYTCTTGENLYLYTTGGNSGAGTGSNSHITMLAALGTCASNSGDLSTQVPAIQVNEISTVITAYALAGFGQSATAIGSGSSATAQQAMANAFANVPNLLNFAVGQPLSSTRGSTANYTGTVPANKILWLADVLAACVNTDPADSSLTCAGLFAAMPNPFGGTTADTAQVALNMAHTQSPAANIITGLTLLIPAQPAFPYSATTYTDLALPVVYTSPMQQPGGLAIDKNGSVWAFDYDANISASTIYKLSPQGVGTSFATHGSNDDFFNIAISPLDNSVWFYKAGDDQIDAYSNSGSYNFTANSAGLQVTTAGLAFDGSGNLFFGAINGSHPVFEIDNSSGAHTFTSSNLAAVFAPFLSLDSNLNLWLSGSSKIYLYDSPYTTQTTSFSNPYDNPLIAGTGGVMWFPDPFVAQLDSYSSAGAGITCTGGGMTGVPSVNTQSIAVDGAGDLWTGNYSGSTTSPETITGFNPLNGGTCSALTSTNAISNGVDPTLTATSTFVAADSSGNLWSLNWGVDTVANAYAISFTQFLGLTVPAVTPLNPAFVGSTPQ